jgi:hypothetical protein
VSERNAQEQDWRSGPLQGFADSFVEWRRDRYEQAYCDEEIGDEEEATVADKEHVFGAA